MRGVVLTSRYKKDLKKKVHNPRFRIKEFNCVLTCLIQGRVLPERYRNHGLAGEFGGYFECHVQPNILLIYGIDVERNILYLLRIGSHSELFE